MTSKWINQLLSIIKFDSDVECGDALNILEDIDDLLEKAALETDNEVLHDEIMGKIRDRSV